MLAYEANDDRGSATLKRERGNRMSTLELADLAHAYGNESLDDLRKDAVQRTAFGLMGVGALLLLAIPFALEVIPRESWMIAVALAAVGVITHQALTAGLRWAV